MEISDIILEELAGMWGLCDWCEEYIDNECTMEMTDEEVAEMYGCSGVWRLNEAGAKRIEFRIEEQKKK